MNEADLVAVALQSPMFIILVAAQGFVLAVIVIAGVIFLARWLGKSIGKGFIDATTRQAVAVEKIAEGLTVLSGGVDALKTQASRQEDFATEMRLSLRAVESEVKNLGDKIERIIR